jgi:uncharacterized protein (DUF3820 family)
MTDHLPDAGKMIIPFGRYQDWPIDKVPGTYINWLHKSLKESKRFPELLNAIKSKTKIICQQKSTHPTKTS